MSESQNLSPSLWPHRLAVLLVCATFPLIWVGGLVTTYDAGMAVPDWPTTYGYNLFLYPWQTWLIGPWDLFIEHGHRLLGAAVGFLTIALTISLWVGDGRRWMRWLGVAALAGVVLQGVLGGLRVRLDERLFAQIHGCIGPAFFALTAALAVLTSRRWLLAANRTLCRERPLWRSAKPAMSLGDSRNAAEGVPYRALHRLPRLAVATAALAYLQIALGSQLRHVRVTADPIVFRIAVWFHLIVAAALAAHVVMLWVRGWREARGDAWLRRPAHVLVVLVGVQIALGCGAWVANYGWPAWLGNFRWAAGYVVQRESLFQAMITTAHVAVGSLILAVSIVLALRAGRCVGGSWFNRWLGQSVSDAPVVHDSGASLRLCLSRQLATDGATT
jgi:heme a synthase